MKLDNFRLITEVEQRRALWDSYMSMTARKDIGGKQWKEVSDIMQLDGKIKITLHILYLYMLPIILLLFFSECMQKAF